MHVMDKEGECFDLFVDVFSDLDNSFDYILGNTADRFMTDVAVKAKFSDSAYGSDGSELDMTSIGHHSVNGLVRDVNTNSESSSGENASCSEYCSANNDRASEEVSQS